MSAREPKPPYNPAMLRWAREWRGRSLEEAAKKVGKNPEDVVAWEDPGNTSAPTVRQARTLAEFYSRPFMEFFLPEPPPVPEPQALVDFRVYTGKAPPEPHWEVTEARKWAESIRVNALDLLESLEEKPPEFPLELLGTIKADPELVAERARAAVGLGIDEQLNLDSNAPNALQTLIREKLESFGVMVLKDPGLKNFGVRGICVAEFPLPVIVFTKESPAAQAFTIAHEFGHILIREGGISGNRTPSIKISRSKNGATSSQRLSLCQQSSLKRWSM